MLCVVRVSYVVYPEEVGHHEIPLARVLLQQRPQMRFYAIIHCV
jgi:hypothetical protein